MMNINDRKPLYLRETLPVGTTELQLFNIPKQFKPSFHLFLLQRKSLFILIQTMPGFNIDSILSELDSLPSMPNAVHVAVQSTQDQQQGNKIESDTSSNSSSNINAKCGSKSETNRMIIFDVCIHIYLHLQIIYHVQSTLCS